MDEYSTKNACSTLYEVLVRFLKDFGSGVSKNDIPTIEHEAFLRGCRKLNVPMSQQQASSLFRNNASENGAMTLVDFGKVCLPGLDRAMPKWLDRKTMPFNSPFTNWEHSRFHITPKIGCAQLPPVKDVPYPIPRKNLDDKKGASKKVKWGIPFIKEEYVPTRIPTEILYSCWRDKKTIKPRNLDEPVPNTTVGLWARKEHRTFKEGSSASAFRPASVEGPPAEINGVPGKDIGEGKREFWHEWHWRNQWSLRKQTGMDKAPGGAMKVGNAEVFAWPPDIKPI